MENKSTEFKPYIPADKITPELTFCSVITGILLSIIFSAANAYLGLRVGMTISASIPAAVIALGVIRVVLRKSSILESLIVQTIGSAGESVASGSIFTIPVLFLWAQEGIIEKPSLITIMMITVCGGILGVLFMVPLRNSIIVKEHGVLPYPEAHACSRVLLSGEEKSSNSKIVFYGMGFSTVYKIIVDGLKLVPSAITVPFRYFKTQFSCEIYPAVTAVGYICGPRIAAYLFSGGMLAWFVLIPVINLFGGDSTLFPATCSISELYAEGGASAIWSKYIRYIGAGALASAGIISLMKSLPTIVKTFVSAMKGLSVSNKVAKERTSQDINIVFDIVMVVLVILAIWLLPVIHAGLTCAILIAIFGFFFATVAAKMVGLIGSSNNPISGMAIATLLISTLVLKAGGSNGPHGMVSAMTIASIICIISALAGDLSQDLTTGLILGATPKKQQIAELIGAIVAALAMGGILVLLDKAWGFGSEELSAPQATLMKLVTEGVMEGNLPWNLVFIGVSITIIAEILKLPSLAFAIGMYLPLSVTSPVMVGGVIRLLVDKKCKSAADDTSNGVLFSSGLIAGEGIIGIILALLTVCGVSEKMDFSRFVPFFDNTFASLVLLSCLIAFMVYHSIPKKEKTNEKGKK